MVQFTRVVLSSVMGETRVEILQATDAQQQVDAVTEVWWDGFGPIDDLPEWRETVFDRHRAREAYRPAITPPEPGR